MDRDSGIQRAIYFLSPRGEGELRVVWPIPPALRDQVDENVHVGDMLIVYGRPSMIRDGVIGIFPVEYVRLVQRQWYADNVLDYGRISEDTADSGSVDP